MKRAAAIIGPTPSFVRWAIVQQCRFRTPVDKDVPYQTFRQLRALRELYHGVAEKRIVDGVCIHASLNCGADSARGFPVEEIESIFGDVQSIQKTCADCHANASVSSDSSSWAGCFGWFFSTGDGFDLTTLFEDSLVPVPSHADNVSAKRKWFRVWQLAPWNRKKLSILLELLKSIDTEIRIASQIDHFLAAVNFCREHDLELITELIPAGYSNGLAWTIESHCSRCRCEWEPNWRTCDQCGHVGPPHPSTKRKVLGLRPYMILKSIYGVEQTKNLINKYHEKVNLSD